MLINLFITFLNMSISGALVAALLIVWRILSHRFVPSKFFYALWMVLIFRLIMPFTPKSFFSMLNVFEGLSDYSYGSRYVVTMEYLEYDTIANVASASTNILLYAALLWLVVAVALICMWLFFYISAQKRLQYAVLYKTEVTEQVKKDFGADSRINVFISPNVLSPLVIGFFNPRIIIPKLELLEENDVKYAIAHEMVHAKRHDQLIKALFFFVLALHWYNPLVWLSFYIFNEDIETSCDQQVLKVYGMEHKSEYAYVLIDYSNRKNVFSMGYLSFAKNKVAARIEKVMEYKKLSLIKTILFTAVTLMLGLCVSTNPVLAAEYQYIPDTVYVNSAQRADVEQFAENFAKDIENGNAAAIARKSTADSEFLMELYKPFENNGIKLNVDKVFYTSDKTADVYFTLSENDGAVFPQVTQGLVAQLATSKLMGGLYVANLRTSEKYNAINKIDHSDEAVMLVEKMIKFGVTDGGNTPENAPKIAAFCMDIAYDRAKDENMVLIPQKAVEDIAEEFFLFSDYTNMHNTDFFDKNAGVYKYEKSAGYLYECEIVEINKTESEATVTVEFYKDPLQTQVEKTIKYTLKKE